MSFFLTAYEMDQAFVNKGDYLDQQAAALDASPAAVAGHQVILVDTTGGPVQITLDDPATAPGKYRPLVVNVGTGVLTIAATINGISNPQILTQFAGMVIGIRSGQYVTALRGTV